MRKTGKVWGSTTPLLQTPLIEIHRVRAMEGGYCSKHKHNTKHNGFFVLDGELLIRVWKNDYELVDETILETDDFTTVKPGEWHQFEVPFGSPCEFLEFYYLEPLSEDIVREYSGGTAAIEHLTEEMPNEATLRVIKRAQ